MVKLLRLNCHALHPDLTVVYTLIAFCICQQQCGIRRRITVDRYFIAYCVSYVYIHMYVYVHIHSIHIQLCDPTYT